MGRKKGRNSGSRHDFGSYSKQGSLVVQLQRYRHVSQGCSVAASRPAYYEHKQFPDLDAIINARRDDDRVEAVYGFSALDLPRPVAVKVDASRVRCDGDEEEENEDEKENQQSGRNRRRRERERRKKAEEKAARKAEKRAAKRQSGMHSHHETWRHSRRRRGVGARAQDCGWPPSRRVNRW